MASVDSPVDWLRVTWTRSTSLNCSPACVVDTVSQLVAGGVLGVALNLVHVQPWMLARVLRVTASLHLTWPLRTAHDTVYAVISLAMLPCSALLSSPFDISTLSPLLGSTS